MVVRNSVLKASPGQSSTSAAATALTGRSDSDVGAGGLCCSRACLPPIQNQNTLRTNTLILPEHLALRAAMRDYSATPSDGGTCMPCCQVCVFAFTAFLLIAERTARESFPGHTCTHAHNDRLVVDDVHGQACSCHFGIYRFARKETWYSEKTCWDGFVIACRSHQPKLFYHFSLYE